MLSARVVSCRDEDQPLTPQKIERCDRFWTILTNLDLSGSSLTVSILLRLWLCRYLWEILQYSTPGGRRRGSAQLTYQTSDEKKKHAKPM